METEIENYKKSIMSEQERNEQLTMLLNKVEMDIAHVKRQIEATQAKRERLRQEYMTYTRTLQETEQSLARATTVRTCIIGQSIRVLIQSLAGGGGGRGGGGGGGRF